MKIHKHIPPSECNHDERYIARWKALPGGGYRIEVICPECGERFSGEVLTTVGPKA